DIDFDSLTPGPPEFQLAGDTERVAITCAALGVDAGELDLPVALDRIAYRKAIEMLTARKLIDDGRLTRYGREVEALPVERAWGELLVQADPELVPLLAIMANVDSLHRMTRDERDLRGLIANGSDHLTIYHVCAEAVNRFGYLGEVYGLPRHLFHQELEDWADDRGVLVKAVEDAALGMAAVYRSLELPLPANLPYPSRDLRKRFTELLARVMPFDLVIDQHTADGESARVSRRSMAGEWGAVVGSMRYFADRFGVPRAAIEGTTLPFDLVRRFAVRQPARIEVRGTGKRQGLAVTRELTYHGFSLDGELIILKGKIPSELREAAIEGLVDAVMSGATVHRQQHHVRRALEELGELYRRSGGTLEQAESAAIRTTLARQLAEVDDWDAFLQTPLVLNPAKMVPAATAKALKALPDKVHLLGDMVPLDYDLEGGTPVVRLRLREGQARRLRPRDLPELDRQLRFTVTRGQGPAVRARTLEELQQTLKNLPAKGRHQRHRPPRRRRRR
ncbi:MAG: DEAD/DEAH box helicase, partial [Gemmatimonadetes bacterium]|nr:DEAD/DEAH box helicase [Gemmatimonadota bacterium]